tara:strand:- start:44953 stop:46935 length:1983 start_codon:yes stop_codon:yes gene_type:complete
LNLLELILTASAGALDGAIKAVKNEAGRRGSDRIVSVGRRRLDQFKYALIQLKSTEEVCEDLVDFLVDYLGTQHIGIYLWDEAEGSFSLQKDIPGVRHGWRVFEPFLMHMADHDAIILRERPVSGLLPEVAAQRDSFFKETGSDLIVPLVLNESLLGILFIGPPGSIHWTASRLNALSEVRSLVTMALSNSILYARLQGILEHLEEKVKERTRKLEEAQAHLVQSEKMAMLGVMIAGIAHEINTPAGVIFGGSMNLQQNLDGVLDHIPSLLGELGEERLRELLHLSLKQSRKRIHVSGAFKKKRELQQTLQSRWPGADVQKLVGHLVEMGFYQESEDLQSREMQTILQAYDSVLSSTSPDHSHSGVDARVDAKVPQRGDNRESSDEDSVHSREIAGSDSEAPGRTTSEILFEFLRLVSSTGKNLSNIQGSIESIVRIVRALKSYSHPGQKTFGAASVEEGLSNTLIILSSVWKGQLDVHRELSETPEIQCDADELNQVWTNLLTNSWQALQGQQGAQITVASHFSEQPVEELRKEHSNGPGLVAALVGELNGPAVIVTIEDNGPGIPADHVEKIWDPFFTTKDQGEGSGLGLSIVRRIVEEHGGAIGVRSKTGEAHGTRFSVALPLVQDEATVRKKEARNRELQDMQKDSRASSMPFKFR